MHLGIKIKMARMSKGLSQQDLADKINKTRALVSHVEQTGKVNAYTLNKICKALNMEIDQIEHIINESKNDFNAKFQKDSLLREVELLKQEIKLLKDMINMQKDVINDLRSKNKKRK